MCLFHMNTLPSGFKFMIVELLNKPLQLQKTWTNFSCGYSIATSCLEHNGGYTQHKNKYRVSQKIVPDFEA